MITEHGDTIQIEIVGVDGYGTPKTVNIQYMRDGEQIYPGVTLNAWQNLTSALLRALSSWAKKQAGKEKKGAV